MQLTQLHQPCTRWNEAECIEAAKAGDLEAFNQIVLRYQDLLFRIAYRISTDEDRANDALQEAFLCAFQQMHTVYGGSMKGWLIRIVVNKCKDQFRAAQRHRTYSLDWFFTQNRDHPREAALEVPDKSLSVEGCVEIAELERAIQHALQSLPMKLRSILVLADIECMSYEEMAAIERIPMGTVKSRLARARLELRGILLREEGGFSNQYQFFV